MILPFGRYVKEEQKSVIAEAPIVGTGYKAPRHTAKYIKPFIGQTNSHTVNKDIGSTLVLVTHDLTLAKRCQHQIIVRAGQVTSN